MFATELVEYIAKCVVRDPDAVVVREINGQGTMILELSVAPEDMGRIIGKRGQVADAMRLLVNCAGSKEGKRISLEIV